VISFRDLAGTLGQWISCDQRTRKACHPFIWMTSSQSGTARRETRSPNRRFAAIARDIADADALVLHRHAAKPIIALPFDTWRRLLLSVAVASGASPSIWVGD